MKQKMAVLMAFLFMLLFVFAAVSNVKANVEIERYKNKNIEVIYEWQEKPDVYKNSDCMIVKKNGKMIELKIEVEQVGMEVINLTKGWVKFKIEDPETGKVIVRGP